MNRAFPAFLFTFFFSTAVAPAGLISYWNFSESSGTVAHNQVAGGPDGTLLGGAHFVQNTGILGGRSIQFDHATNDLVDFGNNFSFPTGSFSIVVWIKIAAGDTTPMVPLSKYESTGAKNGYFFGVGKVAGGQAGSVDGKPQFVVTGFSTFQLSPQVNDNNWYMVVGNYDSGGGTAGIQNVGYGGQSGGPCPVPVTTPANFLLGGLTSSATGINQFTGLIDEVRVYDSVLSPAAAAAIYSSTVPEPSSLMEVVLLVNIFSLLRHRGLARPYS